MQISQRMLLVLASLLIVPSVGALDAECATSGSYDGALAADGRCAVEASSTTTSLHVDVGLAGGDGPSEDDPDPPDSGTQDAGSNGTSGEASGETGSSGSAGEDAGSGTSTEGSGEASSSGETSSSGGASGSGETSGSSDASGSGSSGSTSGESTGSSESTMEASSSTANSASGDASGAASGSGGGSSDVSGLAQASTQADAGSDADFSGNASAQMGLHADICPGLQANAETDGVIEVTAEGLLGVAVLERAEAQGPFEPVADLNATSNTFVDADAQAGTGYSYRLVIGPITCEPVIVTAVPVFHGPLAAGLAVGLGTVAYGAWRRR